MNCPKCGIQNPDNVQVCTSCALELTQPPIPAESVNVKTSRLAIASLVFGILTLFAFPAFLLPGFNSFVWPIIVMVAAILAIILGIIALVRIGLSAGKLTGKGLASIGTAIPVVLFSMIFLTRLLYRPRCVAFRMVCGSNLSGIGRAMLIYANDYDNELPRAGYVDTKWGSQVFNWAAPDRASAYGKPGQATISSSLYALIKFAEITPKSFCCKYDLKTKPFKASDYIPHMEDEDAWDFGPEPTKHYSYSYHMPYGPYFLSTATSDPGQAVVADRNPWLDSPAAKAADFRAFDPNGDTAARMVGNSIPHKREGQNILFMDFHVAFEKRPYCAVNKDNIYTYWDGSDIRRGAPPTLISQPKGPLDSLLVNDPPLNNSK